MIKILNTNLMGSKNNVELCGNNTDNNCRNLNTTNTALHTQYNISHYIAYNIIDNYTLYHL